MDNIVEIIKAVWKWYTGLTIAARFILSLFAMITAPAIFIIATEIRNPKVITNADFEQTVISKIDDLQHQITSGNLLNRQAFTQQSRAIDSIAKAQSSTDAAVRDLSIVIVANSPDELFRRIAPSLDRIEDNTYRTIIHLQKQEIIKRLDSAGIQVHKIKKTQK